MQQLPQTPGIKSVDPISVPVPSPTATLSTKTSLTDLSSQCVLFTYGTIFTHGFAVTDPIEAMLKEKNSTAAITAADLPKPLFKFFDKVDESGNVVDSAWNFRLCFALKKDWAEIAQAIDKLCMIHRDKKLVMSFVTQIIPVVDVLALYRSTELPTHIPYVPVVCMALSTSRRLVYFAPELRENPWDPIPVMFRSPEPAIKKYAKSFFAAEHAAPPSHLVVQRPELELEDLMAMRPGAMPDESNTPKGLDEEIYRSVRVPEELFHGSVPAAFTPTLQRRKK